MIDDLPIWDQCLVHRVLYYCYGAPVLTDREYDMLERDATLVAPKGHLLEKPGSDREETYDWSIINIARNIHERSV